MVALVLVLWCVFSCCLIHYLLLLCMIAFGFEFMVNSVGHFRALVCGFRWFLFWFCVLNVIVCSVVVGAVCVCGYGCFGLRYWLACGYCGCWCLVGRVVVTCVCWLLSVVYVGVRDFFFVGVL